jgi:tetratricopeptide (TPR) repeat protein
MSRLEQLRQFAAAQPDDPLAHYGLALEYANHERWDEALAAFEQTLRIDRQYVAAHHQKARVELKLGRRAAAAESLRAGIAVATAKNDAHAASKMKEMLESLE